LRLLDLDMGSYHMRLPTYEIRRLPWCLYVKAAARRHSPPTARSIANTALSASDALRPLRPGCPHSRPFGCYVRAFAAKKKQPVQPL
jgi:hypothetical protein